MALKTFKLPGGLFQTTYDDGTDDDETAARQGDITVTGPQPLSGNAATFSSGGVGILYANDTYDGYTLVRVIRALREAGILA